MDKKNVKISQLQTTLTIIFVAALMISNIISSRIFNFFGFNMTSGVFVFPITYILSDIFSEVYGYHWSRKTCYMAFAMNLSALIIFSIVSKLPTGGDPYNNMVAESFRTVLTGSVACSLASFIAFVLGDFVNDKIFFVFKKNHEGLTNHEGFGVRAIISSFAGELVDSTIYLPLAFLVINPVMKVEEVLIMIALQVVLKTGYEIVILPITTLLTKIVSKYEEKYT